MNKLVNYYMSGLVVTVVVATSAIVLFSGIKPVVKERPTPECYELVAFARDEFKFQCEARIKEFNIENKVFEGIEKVRVKTSTTNNCNPNLERWYCLIDGFGTYKTIFQ